MEFKIEGTVVNTDKAVKKWDEITGSQGDQKTLYQSPEDRYYFVRTTRQQGTLPSAEFVSDDAATRWLLDNRYELPALLKMRWSGA